MRVGQMIRKGKSPVVDQAFAKSLAGASSKYLEGYGATLCVVVSMLTTTDIPGRSRSLSS